MANMVTGMAIFIDFERKTYTKIPAKRQAIAVRVPEGNIAQTLNRPTTPKKILNFNIFVVKAKIRKATAVDAIPMPKAAASL